MAAAALSIAPFLNKVNQFILNPLITLVFAIAFIVFLVGIVQFMKDAGDGAGRELGRKKILYGLIGMFIMFSAYGLIHFILDTLELGNTRYIP